MTLTEPAKGQKVGGVGMEAPHEVLPHPKSDHCSTSVQSPCDLPKRLTLTPNLAFQTPCKLDWAPACVYAAMKSRVRSVPSQSSPMLKVKSGFLALLLSKLVSRFAEEKSKAKEG